MPKIIYVFVGANIVFVSLWPAARVGNLLLDMQPDDLENLSAQGQTSTVYITRRERIEKNLSDSTVMFR